MVSVTTARELHEWLDAGASVAVVDVRLHDYPLGQIKGAFHFPLDTFELHLDSILASLKPYQRLVFHCNSCLKETLRGPRFAGVVEEAVKGLPEYAHWQVLYLEGGFKGWWTEFGETDPWTVPRT